jgi:SAM-dependent methyltransferase
MPDRGIYGPDFAELYDLFHQSKGYAAEAAFVRRAASRFLQRSPRPVRLLDVACGTGSHAVELSRAGFAVTGVDGSEEMLRHARRKARAAGVSVRFEQQTMEGLAPAEQFDVVTCLFDSIGYLRTDRRVLAALRRMFDVLEPGGILILEVWHARPMLRSFDPVRIRRVQGKELEAVRIGETTIRPAKKIGEVRYEIFMRRRAGPWRHFVELHSARFFTRPEIASLVRRAGFRMRETLGGYDETARAADAWHLLLVAQRPDRGIGQRSGQRTSGTRP